MAEAPQGRTLAEIFSEPVPLSGTVTPVGTPAPEEPSLFEKLYGAPPNADGPTVVDKNLYTEELMPFDRLRAATTGPITTIPSAALIGATTSAGFRLGAMTQNPYAALGGGLLGFGTGLVASLPLDNLLKSATPERYFNDPRLIPYFQGGRTFGMTIGTAPMAFGLPALPTTTRLGRLITGMRQEARTRPVGMLAGEAVSATGAGLGAGMVLSVDPTAEGTRMGAEIIGGMFTPVLRIVSSAARNSGSVFDAVKQRFSSDAREYKAAEYLRNLFKLTGEDPEKILARLAEDFPAGVPAPSSAQRSGSLALTVLENTLAKGNPAFGTQIDARGQAALRGFETLVRELRATGDPAALQEAARYERQVFQSLLSSRIRTAEENAAGAIRRIQVDGPQEREAIGNIFRQEVESALEDARQYETALWRQAELEAVNVTPGAQGLADATVTPRILSTTESTRGMLDAFTSVTPEYLRSMPGFSTAEAIARRFGVGTNSLNSYRQGKLSLSYINDRRVPADAVTGVPDVPVSYMIQARGDLLGLSRQAASTGDMNASRIYGQMAESILGDLDTLQTPAYNRAREYSRELNDTFTRTFANDIVRTTRQGAERLPAEIMVSRAFGSNNDLASLRMEQVLGAADSLNARHQRLLAELGPDHPQVQELAPFATASAGRATTIGEAQRRWLTLLANKAFIPDAEAPGGYRLNNGALQGFIATNERELTAAGLINDLRDVQTADALVRQALDGQSAFNRSINDQTAFGRLLGNEDPVRAITDALRSRFPARQLNRLITLSRQARAPDGSVVEGASDGLKSILFDYAYTAAGGQKGSFSPTAYYDTLFQPLSRGQPSILQMMVNRGVMTYAEKNNVKRLLLPMMQIENVMGNNQQLDQLLQTGTSPIQEIILRVAGAKLGRLGGGSGESLVLAGAGSRMLRDAMQNQPTVMISQILQSASKDPKYMATLMQKVSSQTSAGVVDDLLKRLRMQSAINGLNITTGSAATMQQYEPVEQPSTGAYEEAMNTLRGFRQPPAPSTRGVPNVPGGGNPTPAGGAPTIPPQQAMNSRQMLQRLFPFDSTLSA